MDSRLAGILILTHIDWSGGKLNFENDPYFPIWQKFGFCDTSANMADFYAKMRAKGRFYTFEPHLNNWNSHPGDSFSWYSIFEVTPPNMAIFEISKFQIIEKISHLWVKFRNFCISKKTSDHQLYSLKIWAYSDTNSRNARHMLLFDLFVPSR